MYFIYERDQWRIINTAGYVTRPEDGSPTEVGIRGYCPPPPDLADIHEPKKPSAFKPTWPIRVADMKRVPGSEVHERYYALSCSWDQSGDYFQDEDFNKCKRDDQGKHQIILYCKKKTRKHPRGRAKKRVAVKPRFVKYEYLIQQICKDFGARYIWWDQWCIDQSNKEERQREIKQMHKIYSNAYCTFALVPELELLDRPRSLHDVVDTHRIMESHWIKRVWTMEEAFMSKRLLFIGRNAHMWSHVSNGTASKTRIRDGHSFTVQRGKCAHAEMRGGVFINDFLLVPMTMKVGEAAKSAEIIPGRGPTLIGFLHTICTKTVKWNACIALQIVRSRISTRAHDRYFALANMFPDRMANLNFSYDQPLVNFGAPVLRISRVE